MRPRRRELLAELRRRFPGRADVAEVTDYLSSEGYDRRQIGEILSRFRADSPPERVSRQPAIESVMTFRVLGPHEVGRFAPEAWGHLLALSSAGALSGPEMEHVIERALLQFEGRIALDDLRALMDAAQVDGSGTGLDQVNIH
jgi:uncharacterized protein Smg (DUF494 family)